MNIKQAIRNYWRVLKITKRPSKLEFTSAAKITGIGICIIGGIGFILYLIAVYTGILG